MIVLGIVLLVLGLLFLLWWRVNPLKVVKPDPDDGAQPSAE